ncbi:hypothetical protein [Pseudoxanthomonas sp. J35]|uniref:hypothetical protein n=1 Tax=Pseudoxanthomonas sp. J35 TaxID=935852 RepID=UPI0012EC89DE|nr:hypothetical protein [Pseudoxanthomonas sp. J35]
MKLRVFTGLACALALAGCTTYGYVDDGGGYYTGYDYSGYGTVYGSYGYGYGVPYAYRYRPGWSFGLGYGHPSYYYGYGYPGYYYRPPHYHPHAPAPPGPGHHGGDHDGRPDRPPPTAGHTPPPLNRAPWRDLERLRRGSEEDQPRRRPQPGTGSIAAPQPGMGGGPGPYTGGGMRPVPPTGTGYRVDPPQGGTDTAVRRRFPGNGGNVAPVATRPVSPQPQPRSGGEFRQAPRSDAAPRSAPAPRPAPSGNSRPQRSGTRDTNEP